MEDAPAADVPDTPLEEPALEDVQLALQAIQNDGVAKKPVGYIIAKTQRGAFRRLHFGGGCKRIPGEHYLDWEELGDRVPAPHEFNARCLHCFPADKAETKAKEEKEASDVGSASSSDEAVEFPESAEASAQG